MSTRRRIGIVLLALATVGAAGCGWFDDPTPEYVFFKIDGPAGAQVQAIYSTQFVAAVNEQGVTQVNVFARDTVVQTLPVDTSFYVGVDRRWFVELVPMVVEELDVRVRVDVDERNVLNESGKILRASPWRFAYLFNQQLTRVIDTVL